MSTARTAAPPPLPGAVAPLTEGGAAPTSGLRDRKKRATRRALRLAALRLVAERGLDGVTTDDIAAAADVSPRTFFNYFAGKEAALVGHDPDLPADLARGLLERPAGESPLEALRAVFVAYAALVVHDEELWRLRHQVTEAHPVLAAAMLGASAELDRAVTGAIAARLGVDPVRDPYPALAASVAAAAARTAIRYCGVTDGARPLADVVAEAFDTLAAGLAPRADTVRA